MADDQYLEPQQEALQGRFDMYAHWVRRIEGELGGWGAFTRGFDRFGLNPQVDATGKHGLVYREWAPGAHAVSLVGDFNDWNPHANACSRDAFGCWSVFIADPSPGQRAIRHLSHIKTALIPASLHEAVVTPGMVDTLPSERYSPDAFVHRIPAWARYATLDEAASAYCAVHWEPPQAYAWRHPRPLLQAVQAAPAADIARCLHVGAPLRSAVAPLPLPQPLTAGAKDDTAQPITLPQNIVNALHERDSGPVARVSAEYFSAGWGGSGSSRQTTPPSATAAGAAAAAAAGVEGSVAGATLPCDALQSGLRVIECHVGMSVAEERVGTYAEFAREVLPRVKAGGYNAIQLMGVMEHAYYASFGYHVTSFHAVASRSGTPDDFKALVDAAHGLGLVVIVDCVHSHASKNVEDGLNQFDGTGHQYFHEGGRGQHDQWDSRLFNYSHPEVMRFLLSNLRWFVQEYRVDGFRFDGVTSMMYKHHGIGTGFSGGYHEYFGEGADMEAQVYLMLANRMLKSLVDEEGGALPVISMAEDVSGMPGLCRPVWEGGLGFDYRLAMAVPDMWIKMLKEQRDEEWDMGHIAHTLLNRRWRERTIAYAESHDQALVGDKTLAMWLFDAEMYHGMSRLQPASPAVHRGMALHKMIRLITLALAGEAYLAFEGNTFGHPEWLDFPREGNGWSYKHCRRQWGLVDDPLLRYAQLENWDRAMQQLQCERPWLYEGAASFVSLKHQGDKLLVAERGEAERATVFVFNWHPDKSFTDYPVPVPAAGEWRCVLSSDASDFGGLQRVDCSVPHHSMGAALHGRADSIKVYSPSRSVQVYRLLQS